MSDVGTLVSGRAGAAVRLAALADLAGVGGEETGEEPDRGGLAGPVRAQEGEEGPGSDVQGDSVNRDSLAEASDEPDGGLRSPGWVRITGQKGDLWLGLEDYGGIERVLILTTARP